MRKKLFAVIMSAMMMITFMPTMAFAETPEWNKTDYSTVSYAGHTYKTTKYVKINGGNWDGKVWVKSNTTVSGLNDTWYYDLNNASVNEVAAGQTWDGTQNKFDIVEVETLFGATAGQLNDLDKMVDVNKLTFEVPSEVKKKMVSPSTDLEPIADTDEFTADVGSFNGYEFKATVPAYDYDKMFSEDQKFTLTVDKFEVAGFTGIKDNFFGAVKASAEKTISKKSVDINNVDRTYYLVDGKAVADVNYNGAAHKVTQRSIDGLTSTFQVLKDGKWVAASGDALEVKDVATYYVKATAKDKDGKTKEVTFDFDVYENGEAYVAFKDYQNFNVGSKNFKAADYLEVVSEYSNKDAKKAVNADKALIMEFFNDFYEVNVTDKGEGKYEALIEEKDLDGLTVAEKDALIDKYSVLVANYSFGTMSRSALLPLGAFINADNSANFKLVDDIQFTKAPLTKTYKAKKGKLPKNKTFKIKAKAASGSKLVYKVTKGAGKIVVNRNTGKVTVKKGLKKGTYKVGVYAVTLDTFDGALEDWVQDHYTLKIKVK